MNLKILQNCPPTSSIQVLPDSCICNLMQICIITMLSLSPTTGLLHGLVLPINLRLRQGPALSPNSSPLKSITYVNISTMLTPTQNTTLHSSLKDHPHSAWDPSLPTQTDLENLF